MEKKNQNEDFMNINKEDEILKIKLKDTKF